MRVPLLLPLVLLLAGATSALGQPKSHTFAIGTDDFLLDGQRFQIRCGEIHAARVPREYWRHRLQMAKAMGLNTVCAYLFWNMHEPRPGEFDWSGQADVAEFCRLAQQEGLWVILRPGPYACAEWEGGGIPWWLLKHDDIKLRSRDPRFMSAARRYLLEVGRALAPLQVTRGGPILMVQVENEYGSYGNDTAYMGELRQAVLDAGFDVPLFACNPTYDLRKGFRADLFQVVNFGTNPEAGFAALRQIMPRGPLMCGEFYPGWFDTWGSPHHVGKTEQYLKDLDYMLSHGASFSIYMAHGGTSFGFWSGADRPFKPDTSSYDYDAPISEAGWATDKFFRTRELFRRYLLPGETIPEPPARNPVMSIPPTPVRESAALFANLPPAISEARPRNFEQYDQAFGCILHRTTVPAGPAAWLEAKANDIGQVFLNGQRIGFTDRRSNSYRVLLPARTEPATLDLLIEAMGRVNFGVEIHDRKGVRSAVKLGGVELLNWRTFNLPFDRRMLEGLRFTQGAAAGPAFHRVVVDLAKTGDTWLDLRGWGKGYAWVNGHHLGRYWNIGPQQTMYVPAPWLKKGANEIIILDLLGTENPVIAALDHPILDELRPEKDFSGARRPEVTLHLDGAQVVHAAAFAPGTTRQEVQFAAPATGRFFCLETLSAQEGEPDASIAELDLLDAAGQPLGHEGWLIAYVDSEERTKEDGTAENAIDGQTANSWRTEWSGKKPPHPHRLILDLGQSREVAGLRYTPRQGKKAGQIKEYRVLIGDRLVETK